VSSIIAAGLNEHFESGYESNYRKRLADSHRRFGRPIIEALCTQVKSLPRPYSGLLRETFAFLSTLRDDSSKDDRLVFLASYLQDPSPIVRDSAATAIGDMADKRAIDYLRSASEKEKHPRLKFEFLEIAAELEA
jgi:HEAT repeat protein